MKPSIKVLIFAVILIVVLVSIKQVATQFLPTCDVHGGWKLIANQSCACFGLKIPVENSLERDGGYISVCLGKVQQKIQTLQNDTLLPSNASATDAANFACTLDAECGQDSICDFNQICSPTPEGISCSPGTGSKNCLKKCETDAECSNGQVCSDYEKAYGDAIASIKVCR